MRAVIISISVFILGIATFGYGSPIKVDLENSIALERRQETIVIDLKKLKNILPDLQKENVTVLDGNKSLITQVIDLDGDGVGDQLLFQVNMGPGTKKTIVIKAEPSEHKSNLANRIYIHFLSQRKKYFTWENNLVAFRMYGPALVNAPPGSGIDCWLKRVKYPIIEKWYKQEVEQKISYDEDRGEGCDAYHVGSSRGCGGLAIIHKGKKITSNVFNEWKIIANGPIRALFELTYDQNWPTELKGLKEVKRISLDLGCQLLYIQSVFTKNGEAARLPLAIGLNTHETKAETSKNKKVSWISCWEGLGENGNLGTGVLIDNKLVKKITEDKTKQEDKAHIWIRSSTDKSGKISYYAGYGWDKAGEITSQKKWQAYLTQLKQKIDNPIKVSISH